MHGRSSARLAGIVAGVLLTLALVPTGAFAASVPVITSQSAATFTVGVAGNFTVTTVGTPTPVISESGATPIGVALVDNGNGTATLSGTPAAGSLPFYQFTIRAANGTVDATQDFILTVIPGTSPGTTHLVFLSQPGGGAPSAIWAQQPVVEVVNALNQVVTTDNSTVVTLSIATNPVGGTLSCTGGTSEVAVGGYAYFSGCSIDLGSASPYTLYATSSPVWTPATSSGFYVGGGILHLAFITQPGGGLPGAVWAQQPVVAIETSSNAVVADNSTFVTLSIATNPAGGTLSCTSGTTLRATNGYVYFGGCSINNASASSYTLTATSSPVWTPATSLAFTIGSGGTNLAFLTQPGGGQPGVTWAQQPVVSVHDNYGNLVTTGTTVTLAISANPGGGTLYCSGGTSIYTTSGYAYFTGCNISTAGVGYTLTATSNPYWTPATSLAFTIGSGGTNLAFLTQPGGGQPGVTWAQQPVVSVHDNYGNLVTTGTTVTLAISANPGGGTLYCSGGTSIYTTSGYAYFTGCNISTAGVGYTLTATSNPYWTPATSLAFTIGSGGTNLAFLTQPGGGQPGVTWAQQPVVSVHDNYGNLVTTGTTVTLAISANPGGGTLYCSGGTSIYTTSGYAYFTGCNISTAGVGYTLTATEQPLLDPGHEPGLHDRLGTDVASRSPTRSPPA